MSLMLPWEVIERVIEHASDDLELLRNFSLTCRQLHPYSFSLIIAQHIFLCSKERMTCFRNLLLADARFQPLIHSIKISPAHVPPFPLVKMLPHLSTLVLVTRGFIGHEYPRERPAVVLHPLILGWYRSFGTRIHTLSLHCLTFPNLRELFRLLLVFPNIKQVICSDIYIFWHPRHDPKTEVVEAKLSNQLRLETLEVRVWAL